MQSANETMASLDGLTDGEIRVKLTELGYPVGPITSTTRKVLLKKLKYLLEQTKSPKHDKREGKSHTSLSKYSSDEESGEDDMTVSTRNRRSMPPPASKSIQKTVKRRSLSRRTEDADTFMEDSVENAKYSYPSASSTQFALDISSSENHKYSPKNITSPNHPTSPNKESRNNAFSAFSSKFVGQNLQEPFDTGSDTDGIDEIESRPQFSPSKSGSVYTSYFPSLSTGLARSRYQPQSYANLNRPADVSRFTPKTGFNSDSNSHNSPFSSDFVRRLSAVSSNKTGSSAGLPSRLLDVKESDDEDGISSPTSHYQNSGNSRKTTTSLEGRIWKNATSMSMVLLFIVCVFFCIIAVVYLNVRYKETTITTTDAVLPICKMGEKPGATCILGTEVQQAMAIFRDFYQVLNDRAVQYACGSGVESSTLSEQQISHLIIAKSSMSVWDVEKHFGNIRVLIGANPQWGVEVRGNEYNISSPNLPLGCYMLRFFYGIIGSALRLIVATVVILGTIKGVYWWFDRQEKNKKEVFRMVESIIDILSTHQQSTAGDNYLAISHVRDQLIPPQHREKTADIWNQAVSYLEENESRVRTEVQQVLGEEFRVWRWLSAPRTNGKRKVWQGQAFETMEGSVNSLPISPTPCLKIRHMFDSYVEVGEEWVTRVKDAILEKCEGVNVLHVAVDPHSNEGCVYVKCASPHDAGRAYRALHGSWFDSKLVTVKYLRLERYHERFPEAIHSTRTLRPSNDKKLSLQ